MGNGWLSADWPAPGNIVAGTTLRGDQQFELPSQPQWLEQVHGVDVVRLGSPDFAAGRPRADASVADYPGATCAVRTADCLPILICSHDGREIAAVHAGWRGLAGGVAENAVAAMKSPPEQLIAWFGPAISQMAFEVGGEVRDAFIACDTDAAEAFVANSRGRWQADLYLLARQRLAGAGVTAVYGGELCTYADPQRFFSYRRDGQTGRLISFIYRSE